ncbi:Protein of unknown function [Bacillus thuringiensis]|uniref:Uncharacterized protein n=1 Tax=Bacillus thuringiensis TaxID=1428 RepID=A0A1C4CUU6_BACTU|nr:Protein of unknown function [Bacillus thuringiensis]
MTMKLFQVETVVKPKGVDL